MTFRNPKKAFFFKGLRAHFQNQQPIYYGERLFYIVQKPEKGPNESKSRKEGEWIVIPPKSEYEIEHHKKVLQLGLIIAGSELLRFYIGNLQPKYRLVRDDKEGLVLISKNIKNAETVNNYFNKEKNVSSLENAGRVLTALKACYQNDNNSNNLLITHIATKPCMVSIDYDQLLFPVMVKLWKKSVAKLNKRIAYPPPTEFKSAELKLQHDHDDEKPPYLLLADGQSKKPFDQSYMGIQTPDNARINFEALPFSPCSRETIWAFHDPEIYEQANTLRTSPVFLNEKNFMMLKIMVTQQIKDYFFDMIMPSLETLLQEYFDPELPAQEQIIRSELKQIQTQAKILIYGFIEQHKIGLANSEQFQTYLKTHNAILPYVIVYEMYEFFKENSAYLGKNFLATPEWAWFVDMTLKNLTRIGLTFDHNQIIEFSKNIATHPHLEKIQNFYKEQGMELFANQVKKVNEEKINLDKQHEPGQLKH